MIVHVLVGRNYKEGDVVLGVYDSTEENVGEGGAWSFLLAEWDRLVVLTVSVGAAPTPHIEGREL